MDDTSDTPWRLRDLDHGDLFGVYLALHGVPDALLLLHTTVGCKFKTQRHLVEHDWARESHHRRVWTGLDDLQMIRGSADEVVRFASTWYGRRRPALLALCTNATVELTGLDLEDVASRLRNALPCPVVVLRTPGFTGSLWTGYRRTVDALLGLADWSRPGRPDACAVAGYVFDRYEKDHAANLAELNRLLRLLGLEVPATIVCGEPLARLQRVSEASTLALLPVAHALADGLARRTGRTVARVDLPLGLQGTATFLRQVGAAAGIDAARVEAAVDRELARTVPMLVPALGRFDGLRAAVFLDTPTAAALTAFLVELGLEVPLACLTDGDDADPVAFAAALDRLDCPPEARPRVAAGPSRDGGLDAFRTEAAAGGPIGLVLGTDFQRQGLRGLGVPVVEVGFPSTGRHCIYPMPWMGFAGAVALAQRLLDAAMEAH